MPKSEKNSAKWPILLAVVSINRSGALSVRSNDVLDLLQREGVYFRPEAVRMSLMRYAKRRIISRQKDESAPPYPPVYRYWPNSRTYATLRFLKYGKGEADQGLDSLIKSATSRRPDNATSSLTNLAKKMVEEERNADKQEMMLLKMGFQMDHLAGSMDSAKRMEEEREANESERMLRDMVFLSEIERLRNQLKELRNELEKERSEKRLFQLYTLLMNNWNTGSSHATQTTAASPPDFSLTYREPVYFDGKKVISRDGKQAYSITATTSRWSEGELAFSKPPVNPAEAEIWNGVDWQPLKPRKGAITHGLVDEPVLVEGKIQYDEFDLPRYQRKPVPYIYNGERWRPLHTEEEGAQRARPRT